MAEPYLGEVRLMSFDFAPKGWALCNGQLLPKQQNAALGQLLGQTFGGSGTNFALPDLRGRTPIHAGNGHTLGESGGEESHTLGVPELPAHVHTVAASTAATGGNANPTGRYLGGANNAYKAPNSGTATTLQPGTVANTGGGQAHPNMQPYMTLSYCIALQGIFPPQN